MYFPGVGEMFDRGYLENGPETDFFRYPEVEKGVDAHVAAVRKPVMGELSAYITGEENVGEDPPTDHYEAQRRIREALDRTGPREAKRLLVKAYIESSSEGPVAQAGIPDRSEFQIFDN